MFVLIMLTCFSFLHSKSFDLDEKFNFYVNNKNEFKDNKKLTEGLKLFSELVRSNYSEIVIKTNKNKNFVKYDKIHYFSMESFSRSFDIYKVSGNQHHKVTYDSKRTYFYDNKKSNETFFLAIINKHKLCDVDMIFIYISRKKNYIQINEYHQYGKLKYYIEECSYLNVQEYKVNKTKKVYR